jgi:hypothetical protein
MHAKLSIYLNFAGVLIVRPYMLILGGGDAAGRPASARLAQAATPRRFVGFFAALCEAFCLLVFVLSRAF